MTKRMKSVGVIGGLGPETTAEFYLEIIFQCQQYNTEQRPLVVISSVPLLLEIERDFLASNKNKERYLPFLVTEAQRLERSGVDFLVMPCNSLHVFIDEIRAAVSIPVLSIVEEAIKYFRQQNFKTVGLISTGATIANKVYESGLTESDITFVVPNDLQRVRMNQVIQRLVSGQHLDKDREQIVEVVDGLAAQGVDCVALACTDLQLLRPSSSKVSLFDTMKILAESTVNTILLQ